MLLIKPLSLFLASAALVTGLTSFAPDGEQDSTAHQQAVDKQPARTWKVELGKLAPDFELKTSGGETWKLSAQRGRVCVLEWYNPKCPVVNQAHEAGGSLSQLGNDALDKGIVWVGINSGAPGMQGAGVEANEEGRKRMGLRYPILLDESGWVGRMYEATNTPHMFIIDKDGTLVYRGGHQDQEGGFLIERALLELGSGSEVSTSSSKAFGCTIKYSDQAKLGMVAPNFTLSDYSSGAEHTLADLRGSYVVLEWFNPGCPVVKKAHAEGGALETSSARQMAKGVKWLAINSGAKGKQGTSKASNAEARKRWKLTHPILIDSDGKVGRRYGAKTTPQMFLIDPRGVIIYAGAHQDQEGELFYIDRALAEVRAGKPVSVPETRSFGCSVKY